MSQTPTHPTPLSSPVADVVHACVVAGGLSNEDTHYLRAGRGQPVLLLAGDPAVSAALIGNLPRHLRGIAPKLAWPSESRGFISWLRGFLDALGITTVSIVVGPCYAAQVLGFCLLEPDRVRRLVILIGPGGDWIGDGEAGMIDRLAKSGQPLFATPFDPRDQEGASRTVTAIANFLEAAEIRS